MKRKKILFFSHAVTLAHLARPLAWIQVLDFQKYDIYLATDIAYKKIADEMKISFIPLSCIDSAKFSEIVNQAQPIYDCRTFSDHIREDLMIIEAVDPDIVIGDFRHSLTVSARLKKVKYINLTNAYWSPKIQLKFPVPEAPFVRAVGEKFFEFFLKPFLPFLIVFNFFKMSWILRRDLRRTVEQIGDYRKIIVDGDVVVFCDSEDLVPLTTKSSKEIFVGPLIWSMTQSLPSWWDNLKKERRKIFVSLGSSGDIQILPLILRVLSNLDFDVIVALGGKKIDLENHKNLYVSEFLPIDEVMKVVSLCICNGGSPMTHAALTWGVPVIGIIFNNDQLLNMKHIEGSGAGIMLRYWNLSEKNISQSIERIFTNETYRDAAKHIHLNFKKLNTSEFLKRIIEEHI